MELDSNKPSMPLLLHGKWDLYYHLPNDKNWDLKSYKSIKTNLKEVDEIIALNENIPERLIKYCMLFVMRSGITPMWEDKENRNGGCFSYKVSNKHVYNIWKTLFYGLCGESLCKKKEYNLLINGITVSPKKNFCIVKIWLKNCDMQDAYQIIDIQNLSLQGCIFKKHNPEF